jgi:NADH dehydrogenase
MPAEILILGGGFGGLTTARKLEQLLRPEEASITVVSRENFSLFTPMLPEVSSGNLEARHVATPVRAQLKRARFVLADVRSLDFEKREVVVEHTILGSTLKLNYDQLVFAVGAVTSTFNLPGVAEHSLPLKTLEDADRLRNHVIAMLELADVAKDAAERKRLLTFAFVGGGFTGVEAAGEMLDFFRSIVKFYRSIDPSEVEVFLVEGGAQLLPGLQAGMGEYSARELERRGVHVLVNALVAGADARGLDLKDGTRIDTATIVWSAGVRPSPLVAALAIGTGRGGSIKTNADMSVPGHPGVWAIGDCASIPDQHGGTYAPTAQHAIREGPVLAGNIVATLRGLPTKPFRYEAIGIMASLGARRGVAGLRGKYLLSGFLAWFLWRTYYLARLPGLDRRFRVTVDWTLGLIFPRDIAELRVYTKAAQARAAFDGGMAAPPESGTAIGTL